MKVATLEIHSAVYKMCTCPKWGWRHQMALKQHVPADSDNMLVTIAKNVALNVSFLSHLMLVSIWPAPMLHEDIFLDNAVANINIPIQIGP